MPQNKWSLLAVKSISVNIVLPFIFFRTKTNNIIKGFIFLFYPFNQGVAKSSHFLASLLTCLTAAIDSSMFSLWAHSPNWLPVSPYCLTPRHFPPGPALTRHTGPAAPHWTDWELLDQFVLIPRNLSGPAWHSGFSSTLHCSSVCFWIKILSPMGKPGFGILTIGFLMRELYYRILEPSSSIFIIFAFIKD